ncbi:MAG: DinB family protein [Armatimonadetes bacterium]|nr:DinB family protein [Armatimonadota bacterium]
MNQTLHDLLKARLALVREDLDEAISRLSDADLDWAPTPGMRTVRGQLIEIGATERQLMTWITDQKKLSYEEAGDFGSRSQTIEGLKQALADTRMQTLEYIDSLTAEELEQPFPFPERWFESLRQPFTPRAEALRSLAQHEWYHTGQLVSYLWSRGDNPYKW